MSEWYDGLCRARILTIAIPKGMHGMAHKKTNACALVKMLHNSLF